MTAKEIQDIISERISRIDIVKNLQGLSIEWEKDITKMDFSALRSGALFDINYKYQTIRIENQPIDIGTDIDCWFRDPATFNLIDFIKKGNKLIPPVKVNQLEYCGTTHTTRYMSTGTDGNHRQFIYQYLGFKEIPMIIVDKTCRFMFPIDMWGFDVTSDLFIATSKTSDEVIQLETRKVFISNNCDAYGYNVLAVWIHG